MTWSRPLSATAAVLAATLGAVLPAAPARAHTELSRTAPAANSAVTTPVAAVTLTFTGLVKKPGTTVVVTGPDEATYGDGPAQVLDRTITQKVKPLPVGAITVAWRTVAGDGHPIQGSFRFTNRVAPPTPSASAEPSPTAVASTPAAGPTTALAPAPASGASDDGSSPAVWWLLGAAVALAAALAGGLLWRRRRGA